LDDQDVPLRKPRGSGERGPLPPPASVSIRCVDRLAVTASPATA